MTAPPRLLAAAKINLFLKITGRRPDGLHDLSSLVCFADYGDYLECAPDSAPEYAPVGEDRLALGGPLADALEEAGGAGLITAALQALREAGCAIPPLAVRLEKNLPTGGGLGGGSADAAALLRFLPGFFDQPLPPEQLARLAAGLGRTLDRHPRDAGAKGQPHGRARTALSASGLRMFAGSPCANLTTFSNAAWK